MIPPQFEQLLAELARDAKTEAEFFTLLLPRLHVQALAVLGRPHLLRRLEELRDATEPKSIAPPTEPQCVRCWRAASTCGRNAILERLDANGSGIWRPVCADHARGALPLELRKLPHERKATARVA